MTDIEIDKEYLGKVLIDKGFETWFRYLFRVINNRPFTVEPIHHDLFQIFQDIYEGKQTRVNICLPPRSGKTTLNMWFLVYCITINPRCNFIYTSFNQSLLSDISRDIMNILEHPIYKAMYPSGSRMEKVESTPVDSFWREYLERENKTNVYSNRKIVTAQGGVLLFAAIGSAITGFGAGQRGVKEFSGALLADDPNKPADIHSQTMRDKVLRYFVETLLSRLNDSNIPIVNTQQRLHLEDLAGHLITKYNFYTLRKPLLDHNGVCQIPSQYTPERIKELQFDESMFQAQYQQEPTAEKGLLIKRDWWKLYNPEEEKCSGQVIITADTAFKESQTADFSCIQVWELKKDRMLMRDMVVDKWEFPELIEMAKQMWNKWTSDSVQNQAKYFFIEDKASGTPLQQTLAREGITAIAWTPKEYEYPEDKVSRTKTMSWDVFCGKLYLPKESRMTEYLINESALFSEDMSHSHDDACFVAGTKIATIFGNKNIEDVKRGDLIITPIGIRKCTFSGKTGKKEVIKKFGLHCTKNHKIFTKNGFIAIDSLTMAEKLSMLSLKEAIKWKYKKQLYSMEKNIESWGREDITYLNQHIILKEGMLKDFMLRFGSFILERKFLKAMSFTTKTVTASITTILTLNVFHVSNTLKDIFKKLSKEQKQKNGLHTLKKSEKRLLNGINQKKELNGTRSTQIRSGNTQKLKYALTVEKNLTQKEIGEENTAQNRVQIEDVYNITVENAGCYYANGILVSNCDTASMAHSVWKYYGGGQ